MADCKAKYRNAVKQFIRLVSVDAKAYVTLIKQVKVNFIAVPDRSEGCQHSRGASISGEASRW